LAEIQPVRATSSSSPSSFPSIIPSFHLRPLLPRRL
jgi:hypothetical protein